MGKRKDLSEFDKGQIVISRRLVRASPKLQLLWGVPGLYISKVVQGRNSGEPATGSWAEKAVGSNGLPV